MTDLIPLPIKVWRFKDAPEKYSSLSRNGGDEDWVALVPWELENQYIPWLDEGSGFGVCCVDKYSHPEGIVYIGSHA